MINLRIRDGQQMGYLLKLVCRIEYVLDEILWTKEKPKKEIDDLMDQIATCVIEYGFMHNEIYYKRKVVLLLEILWRDYLCKIIRL